MTEADWISLVLLLGPVLAVAVAMGLGDLWARHVERRKAAKSSARGVGPCGVARVTRPMLHGLEVRELKDR